MTHYEHIEHWIMRHFVLGPDGRYSLSPRELMSSLNIAYRYGDSNGYDDGFTDGERQGESETLKRISEAEIRHAATTQEKV